MLNFREELNKIKEERLGSHEAQYEMVEVCLKGILDYLRRKRTVEIFKEIVLFFTVNGSGIYVKEDPRGKNKDIYSCVFPNSEIAKEVLIHIEQKLLSEGFEWASQQRAAIDGKFGIKINV